MSKYKIKEQDSLYFVTLTVVDWVDIFIRKTYKDIILDSLRYCQAEKGLMVCAYVIMSSHIHMVIQTTGEINLSDILRDFKKFTAKKILEAIEHGGYESRREWLLHRFAFRGKNAESKRKYQFWQADNHPIILYSMPVIAQKITYIHENPIKEGWVLKAEEYTYSSASNYMNEQGVLDITVIDLPVNWIGFVNVH